jgi:hypothetical protein
MHIIPDGSHGGQDTLLAEDYEELLSLFMRESCPATAAALAAHANKILRRRHWSWLLEHPGLTTEVHASRRMPFTCPPPSLRMLVRPRLYCPCTGIHRR